MRYRYCDTYLCRYKIIIILVVNVSVLIYLCNINLNSKYTIHYIDKPKRRFENNYNKADYTIILKYYTKILV